MQFQDGETRVINGTTYVRQGGQWRAQGAGPVFGSPKLPPPQTPVQEQTDEARLEQLRRDLQTAPTKAARDAEAADRDAAKDERQAKSDLRTEFAKLPVVKDFSAVLPQYASALRVADTKAGDLDLIYAFGKIMDPGSVVREGEMVMVQGTGAVQDRLQALMSEFNSSGRLNSRLRRELQTELRNRASAMADAYNQQREHYKRLATEQGDDPALIVGPHPGAPFQQAEADFLGRPIRNLDGSQGAAPRQQKPQGAVEFGPNALPPGAEQFPQQMMAAFKAGEIPADPYAIIGWAKQNGNFDIGLEEAKAAAQAMKKGILPTVATPQYEKPNLEGREDQVVDPLARGVVDAATLGFGDEIVAAGDSLLTGQPFGARLSRERAIRDFDQENNFGPRLTGQVAGGALLPSFGVNSVRGMAGLGAGYGGAYGLGSADENRGVNALMGVAAGGTAGAALGVAMPTVTNALAGVGRRAFGSANPRQRAILDAGDAEGVPVNMSDVFPETLNTVATLETIPGASGPVRKGIEAGRDAIEGRVQNLGRGGAPRENMGDAVVGAGQRFVAKSREQANRLYNVARARANDTPIQPSHVKQAIASLVQRESETPGGTRAGAVIRQYADAFDNQVTIDGARRMRSELAARLRDDGGLSKREATRLTGQIMDALNRDIEISLLAAGHADAVRAYKFADQFYAQRMDEIDRVIEKVIGTEAKPKTGPQAMQVLRSMASPKGDSQGLHRMLKHLTPEERKDFAATLVEPLGRASAEEGFSPATFIRNVRQLSPAARRLIFGADGERSIQNLVRLSNAKKDTVNRLNNSRSGQVTNYRTVLSTVLFGLPGGGAVLGAAQGLNYSTGAVGGAAIAGVGVGVSRAIAKALMNEDFTRALAQAPATSNPRAINAHIGKLRQIAAKDPNVRSAVESLEQQLIRVANDNMGGLSRSAAGGQDPEEQQEQRGQ